MEMFDLEDFKYNFVNLTTFRMVDVENVGVRDIFKQMESYAIENNQTFDKIKMTQVRCQCFCVKQFFKKKIMFLTLYSVNLL